MNESGSDPSLGKKTAKEDILIASDEIWKWTLRQLLVISCCITNYPKLCGLAQWISIISQFLWVRDGALTQLGVSDSRFLTRLQWSCWPDLQSSQDSTEGESPPCSLHGGWWATWSLQQAAGVASPHGSWLPAKAMTQEKSKECI